VGKRNFTPRKAFTLVELLISMSVLTVVMLLLLSITDSTQRIWKQTAQRIDAFRSARTAFESMTRRISQATLNTYWDYDSTTAPTRYVRRSELRFISGNIPQVATALSPIPNPSHSVFFQAPLGLVSDITDYGGMENLLNTFGYYIAVTSDAATRPPFLATPAHTRFRLMELSEPSEALTLYTYSNGNPGYKTTEWFATPLTSSSNSHIIADNVIALVLLPKLSPADETAITHSAATGTYLALYYNYDSSPLTWPPASTQLSANQLPPLVQVTMVAIDESSASRLETISNGNAATMVSKLGLGGLFQTAGNLTDNTQAGYAQDLKTLTDTLQSLHLNYRIFSSEISIRGAKWSSK